MDRNGVVPSFQKIHIKFNMNWLAYAIPGVSLLIICEWALLRKQRKDRHGFDESVANVNVGIAERLTDLYISGLFFYIYQFLFQQVAIWRIPEHWFTWIVLFLLTDFIWYWYHRWGHEVNILWCAHVVHHQSEDFNFTTSTRITVFQALARGIFWSLLPILGFEPKMVAAMLLIHGAYPFFTHTQLIGKLGWLEKILVTPSHHRVHHSSNPEYLDKNYGDVLIIWDKLLGTFAEERTTPVYGLTKPLKSHSFLWQHFHFWLELAVAVKRANSFREKCHILFGKPDLIDPRIRTWLEFKLLNRNLERSLPSNLKAWIYSQTIINMVVLFLTVLFQPEIPPFPLVMISLFIILSLIYTGAMQEKKSWVFNLEWTRILLILGVWYWQMPSKNLLMVIILSITLSVLYYKTLQEKYNRHLLGTL